MKYPRLILFLAAAFLAPLPAQEPTLANTDDVAAAETAAVQRLQETRYIAFIGDSITAQADTFSGNYLRMDASGFPHWVGFHLKGRTEILPRRKSASLSNFGASGSKINAIRGTTAGDFAARSVEAVMGSNSLLSTLINRARDRNPIVVELSGANDVTDVFTYTTAQVAAKRKALWDEMILCGIPAANIVAVAILPCNDATKTTFADAVNTINQAHAAALGITWVPYPAVFKSGGAPVAAYFRDLIHPNKVGSFLLGQAVATAIEPMLPDAPFGLPHSSDGPWMNGGFFMAGSNAVSGTNYSGNLANAWTVSWTSTTTGTTTVLSKVTDAEGEWQRIAVTGSNRENGVVLVNSFPTSTIYAPMKFRMAFRAKGSGFSNFHMQLIQNSTAVAAINFPGADLFSANPLDYPAFDGIFLSPVMSVAGGAKIEEIRFQAAGQGTIDIRLVGLIRCDDKDEPVLTDQGVTVSGMALTGSPPAFSGILEGNATGGSFSVNLPALSTAQGRSYTIFKSDATANTVTLDGSGSEPINSSLTYVLSSQWQKVTITGGLTRWFVTAD